MGRCGAPRGRGRARGRAREQAQGEEGPAPGSVSGSASESQVQGMTAAADVQAVSGRTVHRGPQVRPGGGEEPQQTHGGYAFLHV